MKTSQAPAPVVLLIEDDAGIRRFVGTAKVFEDESLAIDGLRTGAVQPGQVIAHLGDWHENGGWAAHIHFQIMTDMLDQSGNFFGVGHESLWDVWQGICIDPNLVLRLPADRFALHD
mgnify:CR=1 FL=1